MFYSCSAGSSFHTLSHKKSSVDPFFFSLSTLVSERRLVSSPASTLSRDTAVNKLTWIIFAPKGSSQPRTIPTTGRSSHHRQKHHLPAPISHGLPGILTSTFR